MIVLEEVSFSYEEGEENRLRNVSLEIPPGQCVLLCGASGCGKTTLTRMINGLIPHFFSGTLSGRTKVRGMNVSETGIADLSDVVGTVFQNPRTQFFNTDTDSEIVFGLENRGLHPERMKEALEKVTEELRMQNLRRRSIFELSGGEKQKIAFASVYAADPDIFVLDEPSSNLDLPSIEELAELLRKAKSRGKTIVIAEHRLWYLMDIADRVIFMEEGRISEDMDIDAFRGLSAEKTEAMGLRCRDLFRIENKTFREEAPELRLEVNRLTVRAGGAAVLREVSFAAEAGEIVAVAGENGAGKTTLARALCGLAKAEPGAVRVNGKNLTDKMRRKKAYMVMQDVGHQLFTDSVEAECGLGVKAPDEELIAEALSLLELTDFRRRHPLSLSGGQKQRLAVAVSLICGREILVFDEPTSGLDLKSMREVGRLAKKLSGRGKLLLIITHDIEFIKTVCSRALILSGGRIAADLDGGEKERIEEYLRGRDEGGAGGI